MLWRLCTSFHIYGLSISHSVPITVNSWSNWTFEGIHSNECSWASYPVTKHSRLSRSVKLMSYGTHKCELWGLANQWIGTYQKELGVWKCQKATMYVIKKQGSLRPMKCSCVGETVHTIGYMTWRSLIVQSGQGGWSNPPMKHVTSLDT